MVDMHKKYQWLKTGIGKTDNLGNQVQKYVNMFIENGYLNKNKYITHLEEFVKYISIAFGVKSLKNISNKHIESYKKYLISKEIDDNIIFDIINSILYILIPVPNSKLNSLNNSRKKPINLTCPYCNSGTNFIERRKVFSGGEGNIYICLNYPECNSYVGVHKNTVIPLGSLANKELRLLRKECHYYFDYLYRKKAKQGYCFAKNKAYKWLSDAMMIQLDKAHIGMFGIEECNRAIYICKKNYR
ncbi:zinc-finger-containing protein [Vallitalea guaymasensis]|uniref:zinc-finger-containing protein n=1 Tax=Vallitalea guaymasensis TaxID=1185412 RepID=UPI000DE2F68D|nr:zinc-finger-containing protein [Vallitalea guaymasensis]